MNEGTVFSLVVFLLGVVSILTGVILRLYPPKGINGWYGYRTPASMKTQERWDFAQRYAAKRMLRGGLCLLIISVLGLNVELPNPWEVILVLAVLLVFSVWLITSTERAIRKRF